MDGTAENGIAEETLITVENVSLLADDKSEGKGKLVLTPLTVTWHGSDGPKSWGYRDILMHAISKEGDSPALYAQVQGADEYELFELRFVPEEASILDNLYAAFSRGACLNPDEVVEDDGEGEFYFNVEEVEAGLNGEMDGDDDVQEDGEAAEPSS